MERRLGFLAEPYKRGRAGALATAAKALTAAGALTMLLRGRQRSGAVGAGALLLAGSLAERFAIFRAGLDSARDPRYTVVPQRQRVDAARRDARVMPLWPALRVGRAGRWRRATRSTRPGATATASSRAARRSSNSCATNGRVSRTTSCRRDMSANDIPIEEVGRRDR